jgi:hypothetical protein
MNTKKLILLTITIIAAMICLGYVGLQSFGKKLYDSRDCEWGNIDNIELHTRTDIPATKNTDCSYDTILKAKKVVFTLDKNNMDMQEYISESKFTKAVSKDSLPLKDIRPFENNPIAFATIGDLYYKKESHYSMILDSKSYKLWIYLAYED